MAGVLWGALLTILIPAVIISSCACLLFSVLRPKRPQVYQPRMWKGMPHEEQTSQRLPKGICGWPMPVLKASLEDIATTVGVDAAAYIAWLGGLFWLFFLLAPLCLIVLFPVYATGSHLDEAEDNTNSTTSSSQNIAVVSMANVRNGNGRLWAAMVMLWVVAFFVYAFVFALVRKVVALKRISERFFHPSRHYTVLVEHIPEESRSARSVTAFFDELLPGSVASVQPVKKTADDLNSDFKKYSKNWTKWKHFEAQRGDDFEDDQPMARTKPLIGKKVKAIPYYSSKCKELRPDIESERAEFDGLPEASAAFVTFNSLGAAAEAQDVLRHGEGLKHEWLVKPAPEPRNIIWKNLEKGRATYTKWGIAAGLAFLVILIILLWAIPVGFAPLLSNVAALAEKVSWLSWVNRIPGSVLAIVQGLLPVVYLAILNAIVVPLLFALANLSGFEKHSSAHHAVMWHYFAFLVFNSFFLLIFAGSAASAQAVDSDMGIAEILGVAIPSSASFFVLYIAGEAFGAATQLLCAVTLLMSWWNGRKAKTKWEKDQANNPKFFKYGSQFAFDAFVCMVLSCFGVIAPLIMVFGVLYFLIAYVSWKYLLMYHFRTEFQVGGHLLIPALRMFLLGVILGQLVVIITLSIKGCWGAILCFPLPLLTVCLFFWIKNGPGSELDNQGLPDGLVDYLDGDDEQRALAMQDAEVEHVWRQPAYTQDLDQPVPEKFFWRDLRPGADRGSGSSSDEDEASDSLRLHSA